MDCQFDTHRRQVFLEKYCCTLGQPAGQDVSSRRYFWVERSNGDTHILMEAIPDKIGDNSPGHKMSDFVRLGRYLRSHQIYTPEIYEVDYEGGYMLLENFGDMSFKRAAEEGVQSWDTLYGLATDILIKMRHLKDLPELPEYYKGRIHASHKDIISSAILHYTNAGNIKELEREYLDIWATIESQYPACPQSFMHIDYHGENLMWLNAAQGTNKCGVIDYQEAMIGPCAYDLVNLLEDARINVPMDLRAQMIDRYCADMSAEERQIFEAYYRILGTQFHCRVLGLFTRLVHIQGKEKYRPFIPVLEKHLRNGLKSPILKPLKQFFDSLGVMF